MARINLSIKDGSFFANETTLKAFADAKAGNGRVHFLGLGSDGGVHSHLEHLYAFLDMAKANAVPHVFVHFFADGRDTAPTSGAGFIAQVQAALAQRAYGSLATVCGRYWAMDRDKRWERVQLAHDMLMGGVGEQSSAADLPTLIQSRYAAGENDEFLKPIIVDAAGTVQDGDTLIFFNFRADRMREIVEDVGIKQRCDGAAHAVKKDLRVVQMTQYNESFPLPQIFKVQTFKNVMPEWLAAHNVRQFHTAETEKYAHVTFFFNGGREDAFPLEDRGLVPSPKVATYDLAPEMNMVGVCDSLVEAMAKQQYPFVMCNLAAPDMVGHTGRLDKTIEAVAACDRVIGSILAACRAHDYALIITADHGNAEEMLAADGSPKTSHTCNKVPLVLANGGAGVVFNRAQGGLKDVAPTILTLMGVPVPPEMSGQSFV